MCNISWLFTGIHHLCTGYSTGVETYQQLINIEALPGLQNDQIQMIKLKAGVRTEDLKVRGRHNKRVPKQNGTGLKFERVFSREEISPFDEIEW